jgi:hypothetical protein
MHPSEPDPIFHAPRRPRKGPRKLTRKWMGGLGRSGGGLQGDPVAKGFELGDPDRLWNR